MRHLLVIAALAVAGALAQRADARGRFSSGEVPNPEPPAPALLKRAGFDQKLGDQVPLNLTFKDEQGKAVRLQDVTGGKPIILNLAYFGCPMLCNEIMNSLVNTMKQLPFNVGDEYAVLTVSFDPTEGPELAAAKKANYVKSYGRAGAEAGWRFLTGAQPEIEKLTSAVGFTYAYDEKTKQYGHASGVVVLTPDGRISHYFYGVVYPASDVRLALVDAASGKIGNPVDKLLLFCFHYDPVAGKYTLTVMNLVRAAGVITLLALGMIILPVLRKHPSPPAPHDGPRAGGESTGAGT